MKQFFKIIGSARYLPRKCIRAEELDRRSGLEEGWTLRHTGVRFRYQAGPDEGGTAMARRVVLDAVKSASLALGHVDLLVDASLCLQQPIPSNSALVQEALGREASGCATMDVHSSCLGFVVALQTVNGLFAAKAYDRAVIVCGETPLRGVNWDEPESAHLMGDGAAAIVLERCEPREGCAFRLQTFAEGARLCRVEGGGHRLPPADYAMSNRARYEFHMDGKGVHKFASQHLPQMVSDAIAASGVSLEELNVIPHQASGPSIELLARRLGINRRRLHSSVENHGNLVAAGIPFVLHAARAELPDGSPVMLVGTAAGYSQAAAIFTL
ncbi:MAG TPA: 3-oxoacyl-[acyl-carrier-protein] synthase III C-terminal domain-containing protein [Opitutaceae bacterium]